MSKFKKLSNFSIIRNEERSKMLFITYKTYYIFSFSIPIISKKLNIQLI